MQSSSHCLVDRCSFHSLLLICAGLFVGTLIDLGTAARTVGGEPWFQRSLVGLEVGPTGAQFGHSDPTDSGYCAHFSGRDIVQRTVAAHGEYLVIWARDGDYAYYDL
jgi:hypothetical protein